MKQKEFWKIEMADCADEMRSKEFYVFAESAHEAEEKGFQWIKDWEWEKPFCRSCCFINYIVA